MASSKARWMAQSEDWEEGALLELQACSKAGDKDDFHACRQSDPFATMADQQEGSSDIRCE
jgi:hypothetical protein